MIVFWMNAMTCQKSANLAEQQIANIPKWTKWKVNGKVIKREWLSWLLTG
jgi:hypothetical protein